MFEEQDKTPESQPCPSLETIIALQKMLEEGLPSSFEEMPSVPRPVHLPSRFSRRMLWSYVAAMTFRTAHYFFKEFTHKLRQSPRQKKTIEGKSASGSD